MFVLDFLKPKGFFKSCLVNSLFLDYLIFFRVVDQIQNFVSTFDLQGLRDLWQHLNSRLFRRLDPAQTGAINRLESGVLKLYLVNCIQNKNSEKVKDFFEKMSSELHGQSEWKEWFALPFLSNPENNPTFVNYFSRHWQDTLMLSLNNFLAIIFASLPPPKLAQYNSSTVKIKRLREENEVMRNTLLKQQQQSKIQKLPPLGQKHVVKNIITFGIKY